MKVYFSQFGEITNLRLSRNPKRGKSRHYSFIEFKDDDVAKIVATTMNGYMMFNRTLTCQFIPSDQLHKSTFFEQPKHKDFFARQRTIVNKHNKPRSEEEQKMRVKRLLEREEKRKKKLEAAGISYDFNGFHSLAAANKNTHKVFFTETDDSNEEKNEGEEASHQM